MASSGDERDLDLADNEATGQLSGDEAIDKAAGALNSDYRENNDPNQGEGEPPKKKRGRPKRDSKQQGDSTPQAKPVVSDADQVNAQLADENKLLRQQLTQLQKENSNLNGELKNIKIMLHEKEEDYAGLLDQLADMPDNSGATATPIPKGIIFCDEITSKIGQAIISRFKKIDWQQDCIELAELAQSNNIPPYDVVVIMTGVQEILSGTKAIEAFRLVTKVSKALSSAVPTYVISLPPTKSKSFEIDLYNRKLQYAEFSSVNINLVGTKHELLNDNLPSHKCIGQYVEAVTAGIPVPDIRATPTLSGEIMAVVKIDKSSIGMIIGKGGNMIRKINDEHSVKLDIGKWAEPRKDAKDKFDDAFHGVLITGEMSKVMAACSDIRALDRD